MDRPELLKIGEQIDQMITLDIAARGVIKILYPYAREKAGKPLALAAAQLLSERVGPGDAVFIATGWPDRPHITPEIAETDGPPGAAALALALHKGLRAVPIIFIEDNLVGAMAKVMEGAGLRVLSPEEALAAAGSHAPIHAAAVLALPTDVKEAKRYAEEVCAKYRPSGVVVIEKGGMNDKGYIHTSRGAETTEHMAKADMLVETAAARGIASIGIGDGGNEVGMGVIREAIEEHIPYGKQCLCGCGGGIAPSRVTDVLVTASISNWGAYGVAAALAAVLKEPEVMHDQDLEERILWRCADARFIDGITGYVAPSADGLPAPVHRAFVRMLRELVVQWLKAETKKKA